MVALHLRALLIALMLTIALCEDTPSDDCALGEEGCGDESKKDEPIAVLTDEDFQETVKGADMMVVMFYAPWCHHCHVIMELMDDVAIALKEHNIFVGKLDIEANKESKQRYQISGVPEVVIFRNGLPHPYQGPGEEAGAQGIIDYILEEKAKTSDSETVITLTEDNFDNIVNSAPLILVEFYADWCTACQQLEPHYVAAAKRLLQEDPPIPLGRVGVPDQLELAKRFSVGGYPLLIIFRNGKQYEYTGPREEDGIVQYMKRQVGPSSTHLQSAEEIKKFSKSSTDTRVVAFYSKDVTAKTIEVFEEAGNKLRMEMKFGHCTDENVAKEMGYEVGTAVIFYPGDLVSKYETGYYVVEKLPKNVDSLADLLIKHALPLVGEFTKDNQLRLFPHRPLLVAYYDVDWEAESKKNTLYWHNLIASVAKDFTKTDFKFAIANEEDFEADLKSLGLSDWGDDIAVAIWAPNSVKYPMREDLDSDNLRDFIQAFSKNKLKPHLNSEPPPKESKGALIRTVVGTTFEKVVLNPAKNVLIKLCIPEDPDCKKAEEYYPKVAARYEGSDEILFTEMNLNLNDLPVGISTNGELPSFLFSAKDTRETTQVSPKPADDADLLFFLKWRHSIRPTVREDEVERRAAARKKAQKKKAKKSKEDKKKKEKKKDKKKKGKKDEL